MKQFVTPEADSLFSEHLDIPNNSRIFFSGKFGAGKTTFLRNFFSPDSQINRDNHFQVFHLFPINYQVGDNKDVFEYIKFDLLYSLLLTKDLEFDKLKLSPVFKGLDFTIAKIDEILIPFLNLIPKVGGALYKVIDSLNLVRKQYSDHHNEVEFDDYEKALEYLKSFSTSSQGPYEDNFYSQLIHQLNKQIQSKGKSTVLILDDLDRVDPDHIFRLLNIFDAHVDRDGEGNKFGFDKIILVGDIMNIKAIFHQKFGSQADFSGYIDKFYSKNLFHFNIQKALERNVIQVLNGVCLKYVGKSIFLDKRYNQTILGGNILYILIALIKQNQITVRLIREKLSSDYSVAEDNYIKDRVIGKPQGDDYSYTYGYVGIVLIEFLCYLYEDDSSRLVEAIANCKDYDLEDYGSSNHLSFLEVILPLVGYGEKGFGQVSNELSTLVLKGEQQWLIGYKQSNWWFDVVHVMVGKVDEEMIRKIGDNKFNYFDHLKYAIEVCIANKFIK